MIAKRNIAQLWGSAVVPRVKEWEEDLDWCLLAEKMIYESGDVQENGPEYGEDGIHTGDKYVQIQKM